MPKINLNSIAIFAPPLRSLRLIYIHTLLATAFGLNAATSEAGLTANGMENALAGQAAINPDGTAPKAYLNYIFLHACIKNFDPGHTISGFE